MLVFEVKTNSTLNGWEQIDMHSKERFEGSLTQNTTLSAQLHYTQEKSLLLQHQQAHQETLILLH